MSTGVKNIRQFIANLLHFSFNRANLHSRELRKVCITAPPTGVYFLNGLLLYKYMRRLVRLYFWQRSKRRIPSYIHKYDLCIIMAAYLL